MPRGTPLSPVLRQKIKRALKKKDMTPETIAKTYGTSPASVRLIKSKIEQGLSLRHKKNKGNSKFG